MVTTQNYYLSFYFIIVTTPKMAKPVFKTFDLDIFLDIYFCPFLKISVDFFSRFIHFPKS